MGLSLPLFFELLPSKKTSKVGRSHMLPWGKSSELFFLGIALAYKTETNMASNPLPSFPLSPPFHSRSNCTHSTMASLKSADPPVLQKFESKYGESLGRLPTQVCPMTGRRYILWSDIQNAFSTVVRLSDGGKASLLFMVDKDGELYVPFCRRRNDLDKNTSNFSFRCRITSAAFLCAFST